MLLILKYSIIQTVTHNTEPPDTDYLNNLLLFELKMLQVNILKLYYELLKNPHYDTL